MKKRKLSRSKYEELLKEYNTKAKIADQRLLRIEKAGWTNSSFAYKEAQADISMMGGTQSIKGRKRYDTGEIKKGYKMPSSSGRRFSQKALKSETNIKRALTRVNKFLSMNTSTLKGISAADNKRMQTFKSKYGVEFENGDQIAKFFDSGVMDRLGAKNRFDSKTTMKIIGKIVDNLKDIEKAVKAAQKKVKYSNEVSVSDIIQDVYAGKQDGDLAPMDKFEIDENIISDIRAIFG